MLFIINEQCVDKEKKINNLFGVPCALCNVHIIRIKMSEKSETESERDYQPAGEGSAGEVFTQAGEILKHTAGEIFIQQVRFLVNS